MLFERKFAGEPQSCRGHRGKMRKILCPLRPCGKNIVPLAQGFQADVLAEVHSWKPNLFQAGVGLFSCI